MQGRRRRELTLADIGRYCSALNFLDSTLQNVFTTSREYNGFPSVNPNDQSKFDSFYNPSQEEYLVLRPKSVLPEFIVQYRYVRKKQKRKQKNKEKKDKISNGSGERDVTSAAAAAASAAPPPSGGETDCLVPVNLCTDRVSLPDPHWEQILEPKGQQRSKAPVLQGVGPNPTSASVGLTPALVGSLIDGSGTGRDDGTTVAAGRGGAEGKGSSESRSEACDEL